MRGRARAHIADLLGRRRAGSRLLACVVGICAALVALSLAPSAHAGTAPSHLLIASSDGSDTPDGTFTSSPSFRRSIAEAGIAVNEANGRLIVHRGEGAGASTFVDVLDSTSEFVFQSAFRPNVGVFSYAGALAVDNSGAPSASKIHTVFQSGQVDDYPNGYTVVHARDPSGGYLSTLNGSGPPNGPFDSPGSFVTPSGQSVGLAVDAEGVVHVADGGMIKKFGPSGNHLSDFPIAGGTSMRSIAVDSSDSVYVAIIGTGVAKYDAAGVLQFVFATDRARAVAIDTSTDDVYVSDGDYIAQHDSAGNLLGRFGSSPIGADPLSRGVFAIAVDSGSGTLYAVYGSPRDFLTQRLDVFAPGGEATTPDVVSLDPVDEVSYFGATAHGTVNPQGVPTSFHFEYRQGGSSAKFLPWRRTPDQGAGSGASDVTVSAGISGLTQDTEYEVRLVATNTDTGSVAISDQTESFSTLPVPVPAASLDPPAEVTTSSAHFIGAVDPKGFETNYRLDFASPNHSGSVSGGSAGSGTGEVPVALDLTGLRPNTTYSARLVAKNAGGSGNSNERNFTTLAAPPSEVRTIAPGNVTATSALLGGMLNPQNSSTTYYFEWGADSAYGNSLPVSSEADAGTGGSRIKVTQLLSGLSPDTTYHYRIVATNSAGSLTGVDQAFTTDDPSVTFPERGFELVNTPDKNGQEPAEALAGTPQILGNDHILWSSFTGTGDATNGIYSTYLAGRSAGGWQSQNLVPPVEDQYGNGELRYDFEIVSADRSAFAVMIGGEPVPFSDGTPEAVARVNAQGGQTILAEFPWDPAATVGAVSDLVASPGLSRIFAMTERELVPEHATGTLGVYELADGTPELINRLVDGSVPSCGIAPSVAEQKPPGFDDMPFDHAPYPYFSTDPSHDGDLVFFETQGNMCNGHRDLYARDLVADATVLISGPPSSGEPGDSYFLRASADGQAAVYVSRTRLDPADANDGFDLYRWTAGDGNECLTCVVSDAQVAAPRATAVSEDFSYIYFTSKQALVTSDGLPAGSVRLYLLHEGEIRLISSYRNPAAIVAEKLAIDYRDGPFRSELSADGTVLVFPAAQPDISADDSAGNLQYYRYDAQDDSVVCVTCPPPGNFAYQPKASPLRPPQATLSADGDVFVFATKSAMISSDVNKGVDIYEWRNGVVRLITDGVTEWPENGPAEPQLIGVTPDTKDLFFTLGGSLTGYEQDAVANLYDARAGGGIYAPTPPAPCIEDDCQGPLDSPPGLERAGSASFVGVGNPAASGTKRKPPHSRRCRRLRKQSGKRGAQKGPRRKCRHKGRRAATQRRSRGGGR